MFAGKGLAVLYNVMTGGVVVSGSIIIAL